MYTDVPPEIALDGPPEGADLLLQRTLGTVRAERTRAVRRRGRAASAVTATLIAATLAGGVFIGQGSMDEPQVLDAGSVNGARMTVQVNETDGGIHLVTKVQGVDQGQRCWLVVRDKHGQKFTVGSWMASEKEVTLPGSVIVNAADLYSVSVMAAGGQELVTAQVANT